MWQFLFNYLAQTITPKKFRVHQEHSEWTHKHDNNNHCIEYILLNHSAGALYPVTTFVPTTCTMLFQRQGAFKCKFWDAHFLKFAQCDLAKYLHSGNCRRSCNLPNEFSFHQHWLCSALAYSAHNSQALIIMAKRRHKPGTLITNWQSN